jgi:hypothetical protein
MLATLTLIDAFTGNPVTFCQPDAARTRAGAHGLSLSSTVSGAEP